MNLPKPTAYTPLLRRLFGNERSRELQEVEALYEWVKRRQQEFTDTPEDLANLVSYSVEEDVDRKLPKPLRKALDLLASEDRHIWELAPPRFDRMTMKELVEYRQLLYTKQRFFQNQKDLEEIQYRALVDTMSGILEALPTLESPSPFTIPLIYALENPRETVACIRGTLNKAWQHGFFEETCPQLWVNVCRASGRDPDDQQSRRPILDADESTLPLDELVNTYFKGTAFRELLLSPVPLKLTHRVRFDHWHVVGGTGAGKTTLIEHLILHDIASEERPSLVLIEPHGDLTRKLVQADLGLGDRLILIDPRDTEYPVALNPFAVNLKRLNSYDNATREQVTAGVIQTFGYLFSGLTNLALTGKQDVFFRYVTRLMLSLPDTMGRNATILDMLNLMKDPTPYAAAIEALPPISQEFFVRDFMGKTFEGTKEQIRYRLQAIIENPTMARLFTAPETKVDFFTEMNRGTVILVDTAKDFLKEGSSVFGKLIISLILQAVLERAAIPERNRKPTFITVDEAGSFFSSNIDDLLTEARKYKAGLVLAHQYLDQATSSLRASLAANTGIKFVSGLSAQDASVMARDMRTNSDFILSQPKHHFAAHVRSVTPSAVAIPISPATRLPQLSADDFQSLMAHNRARVSLGPGTANPKPPPAPPPPTGDEDISREW